MESLENKLKENEELKAQVDQLEEENQQLAQQLESYTAQGQQEQSEQEAILQALSDLDVYKRQVMVPSSIICCSFMPPTTPAR